MASETEKGGVAELFDEHKLPKISGARALGMPKPTFYARLTGGRAWKVDEVRPLWEFFTSCGIFVPVMELIDRMITDNKRIGR